MEENRDCSCSGNVHTIGDNQRELPDDGVLGLSAVLRSFSSHFKYIKKE